MAINIGIAGILSRERSLSIFLLPPMFFAFLWFYNRFEHKSDNKENLISAIAGPLVSRPRSLPSAKLCVLLSLFVLRQLKLFLYKSVAFNYFVCGKSNGNLRFICMVFDKGA